MILLRIFALLLVALTGIYVSLWFYFRAGEKARLEDRWAAERPPLPQHTFVKIGLSAYSEALRRRMILWVYVVPVLAVVGIIAYVNYA
jgi:hypothetical protein